MTSVAFTVRLLGWHPPAGRAQYIDIGILHSYATMLYRVGILSAVG